MSKKRREIAAANNNYIKQIITYNRRRWLWSTLCSYSNTPKYTIDLDTWLARHGQPLSPTRSERALEERTHTSWLKFVRGPFKKTGDWTSTTVDTGKSFIFVMIKR